jgi:uncharacterized protein YjbJ (UPF0337 family)
MKERVGDATDNDRLRGEGEADEISGNARETLGKGRRKVGEAIDELGDKINR